MCIFDQECSECPIKLYNTSKIHIQEKNTKSGGKQYKRNPGKKYNAKENKKWRELAGGGAESSV